MNTVIENRKLISTPNGNWYKVRKGERCVCPTCGLVVEHGHMVYIRGTFKSRDWTAYCCALCAR